MQFTNCNEKVKGIIRYYENSFGEIVGKSCSKCLDIKDINAFGKETRGLGGRKSACKNCEAERKSIWHTLRRDKNIERSRNFRNKNPDYHVKYRQVNKERKAETDKTWRQNNSEKVLIQDQCRRARRRALPDNITSNDIEVIFNEFQGCSLTGSTEDLHWDHAIALATGHGGTIFGNMIPIRGDLNMSKQDSNIFEWFEVNRQRFNLEQSRFDRLIEWLGKANGMTVEEYRDYVYWCHANPRSIDELKAQ